MAHQYEYPHSQDYPPSTSSDAYYSRAPPPIPPNPYQSYSNSNTAPPPLPPGAYNPVSNGYGESGPAHGYTTNDSSPPRSPTGSTWRESSFISMYGASMNDSNGGGGTGSPLQRAPPEEAYYPNGIGNGNTINSNPYAYSANDRYEAGGGGRGTFLPPHQQEAYSNEPRTFVSASGATFSRKPSISTTTPAYPSYANPPTNSNQSQYARTNSSDKRPLNPPPIPSEYYHQQSQPPPLRSEYGSRDGAEELGGGGGGGARLSNDSSSERYSVYSYPGSIESNSTASTSQALAGSSGGGVGGGNSRVDGLPNRQQSLEHLKSLSIRDRTSSPTSTNDFRHDPIPETEPYETRSFEPRSRQPAILMSPPLDSFASSSSTASPSSPLSSPFADSYSVHDTPRPINRNQAIDSSWTSGGGRRTTSSGSHSSYSYSQSTNPMYASTMQTSPSPSPSLSHSYSFASTSDHHHNPQRRPSQATLSPHSSTAFYRSPQQSLDQHTSGSYPYGISRSPSNQSDLLAPSSPFDSIPTRPDGDQDPQSYVNPAFLSHLAVWLKDEVPRGNRTKRSGVEHWGFTGKEIVDTILKALPPLASTSTTTSNSLEVPPIPPPGAAAPVVPSTSTTSSSSPNPSPSSLVPLPANTKSTARDPRRKLALSIARTLQQSLWFHEVDFNDSVLKDEEDIEGEGTGTSSRMSNQVYTFLFVEGGNDLGDGFVDYYGRREGGGGGLGRDGQEGNGNAGGGDEIPTGVITELTRCESLVCTKENAEGGVVIDPVDGSVSGVTGGCYCFDCPNRPKSGLHRVGSTLSTASGLAEAPMEEAENWASSVPKSILESLNKQEIAYQNQVFELIHGEQKYHDDLALIETGFVEPLKNANPPIIQPHRLPHFLQSILLNIAEIRQHSSNFLSALRAKQSESLVLRGGIGKIVLMSAVEWGKSYIQYTTAFPMADWLFKEEKEHNPRFNDLLMDFHKRPEASKRGFDTFHNRATFRGLRYILLLEQIVKNAPNETDQDRQDRGYLEEAIKVIKQQGKEADIGVGQTKGKVSLRELERNLIRKQGDLHDLELLDESRKFFMSSRVYRRPEGSGFTDQFQEANLILLDNYLITTKAPRPDRDGKQKYLISRRPVPLDLIQLKASSFSEPPVPRSSGFHLRSNRSAGSPQPSAPSASAYGSQDSSLLYPISFFQMGRYDGLVYLYVDTPAQRHEWEKNLKEAVSIRSQRQEASRVIRLEPLADATFGTTSSIGSLNAGPAQGTNQFGKPTCSTPLQTIDGLWLIIAGCQEGIFIGWRGRPQSMQQVVHLAGITQCAVLPDFSFLLVVANKVLVAYALEALIPTKTVNKLDQANKAPQRLSGQKDVSFFRVGKVGDTDPRTLVIYAKKSGVKESVFKALEPVSQNDRAKGGSGGHRFLGFGTGRPEWFRVHKEFFMPSLVTSLQFQRSKLALIGSRGVEIMDLESMRTMTVPDFPSVRHNRNFAALAKRCEEVPTLGMFRIADSKFLLVYADFAFHVGRHGEPIEGPFIEWESKPEQVAFCFPYIFAISPTIIEVRNAFSGRLAQFITGSHIHLTFDGSAISSSQTPPIDLRPSRGSSLSSASIAPSSIESETPVEKRLHVSMRTGAYHVLYEIVIVA